MTVISRVGMTGILGALSLVVATADVARAQSLIEERPGPLEMRVDADDAKRADDVERAAPRRIFFTLPLYPASAAQGEAGTVTLRVTIDESGYPAEVRPVEGFDRIALRAVDGTLAAAPEPGPDFRDAAIDAIGRWIYAPPADGPIALYVQLRFAPGRPVRLEWHDILSPPGTGFSARTWNAAGPATEERPVPPDPSVPREPPAGVPGGIPGDGAATLAPMRVGSTLATPRRITDASPVYPEIARAARVEGTVIIEVAIGVDGRVTDARVLRSIPLLDQAALDAVRQWEFTPTLLNGMPAPVTISVTVNFALDPVRR